MTISYVCLLFVGAAAFTPVPCHSPRSALATAVTEMPSRNAAVVMKKGRKQGGGPKISLKKKKRKTEGELANDKRINEIARREATRKLARPSCMADSVTTSPSRSPTVLRAPVYIRAKGEEEWLECGHVCVDVGTQTSLEDAARYQKRLILEHGTRVHRRLQMQRETLECGLGPCDDDMAAVGDEASDGVVASNVVLIERSAATDEGTLPVAASFALAATCGFLGAPIPDAGHYWSDSSTEQVARDEKNVNLNNALGNAAKSAVAVQTSKTLGLRSLG